MKKVVLLTSILALFAVTGCTGTDAKPVQKAVEKKVKKQVEKKVEKKVAESLGAPTVTQTVIKGATAIIPVVAATATLSGTSTTAVIKNMAVDKVVEVADEKTNGVASQVIQSVK